MDMMLNSLPSRTWNRLRMNESFVTVEEGFQNHTPETAWDGKTASWTPAAGEDAAWTPMTTGMGEDMRTLTAGADLGLIEAAAGVRMDAPMLLKYRYTDGEKAISRLRIHAAEGSEISVILLLDAPAEAAGVSAIHTEIRAEKGARVRLYVAQLLGMGFTCLNDIGGVCEDDATIDLVKLELGAGRLYAGTHIDLKGRNSAFNTNVGYHARRDQRVDMNYVALHHGQRSNSLMKVSGTMEDGSEKVFRGTIDFQQGCGGSKGTEDENVLLMGDDVVNQTIPLILCKEEDVEGNHGASIGQLDEKVLFYLSTRGISASAAQEIIAKARIEAICDLIPDEGVRTAVHEFEL